MVPEESNGNSAGRATVVAVDTGAFVKQIVAAITQYWDRKRKV